MRSALLVVCFSSCWRLAGCKCTGIENVSPYNNFSHRSYDEPLISIIQR